MVLPPHLSLAESCNNVFTTSCYQLHHRVRSEQSSEPTGSQIKSNRDGSPLRLVPTQQCLESDERKILSYVDGLIDESGPLSLWRTVEPTGRGEADRLGEPPSTVTILLPPVFLTEYMAASA